MYVYENEVYISKGGYESGLRVISNNLNFIDTIKIPFGVALKLCGNNKMYVSSGLSLFTINTDTKKATPLLEWKEPIQDFEINSDGKYIFSLHYKAPLINVVKQATPHEKVTELSTGEELTQMLMHGDILYVLKGLTGLILKKALTLKNLLKQALMLLIK